MRKVNKLRWYDFIVAGIIPLIIWGFPLIGGLKISAKVIFYFLLWYAIFLGLAFILNKNPKLVEDIEKGQEDD